MIPMKPLVPNPDNIRHAGDVDVVLAAVADMYGAFGKLGVYGTKGCVTASFDHTFFAFKAQLVAFIDYLRSGELPFPFAETVELRKIVIAGIRGREQSGRTVLLEELEVN